MKRNCKLSRAGIGCHKRAKWYSSSHLISNCVSAQYAGKVSLNCIFFVTTYFLLTEIIFIRRNSTVYLKITIQYICYLYQLWKVINAEGYKWDEWRQLVLNKPPLSNSFVLIFLINSTAYAISNPLWWEMFYFSKITVKRKLDLKFSAVNSISMWCSSF